MEAEDFTGKLMLRRHILKPAAGGDVKHGGTKAERLTNFDAGDRGLGWSAADYSDKSDRPGATRFVAIGNFGIYQPGKSKDTGQSDLGILGGPCVVGIGCRLGESRVVVSDCQIRVFVGPEHVEKALGPTPR